MLKNVQTLGLGNPYHHLYIDFLGEAAVKHNVCNAEHNFKGEELDLSDTCSKGFNRHFVKPLKEAP